MIIVKAILMDISKQLSIKKGSLVEKTENCWLHSCRIPALFRGISVPYLEKKLQLIFSLDCRIFCDLRGK